MKNILDLTGGYLFRLSAPFQVFFGKADLVELFPSNFEEGLEIVSEVGW